MPHAPDDELLSALLDGEADEDFRRARRRVRGLSAPARSAAPRDARHRERRSPIRAAHVREAAVAGPCSRAHEPAAATTGSKLLRMSCDRRSRGPGRRMSSLSAAAVLVVVLGVGALADQPDRRRATATAANSQHPSRSRPPRVRAPSRDQERGNDRGRCERRRRVAARAGDTSLASPAPVGLCGGRHRSVHFDRRSRRSIASGNLERGRRRPAPVRSSRRRARCPRAPNCCGRRSLHFQNTPAVALVRTTTSSQWVLEIRSPAASGCGLLASQEFEPTSPR